MPPQGIVKLDRHLFRRDSPVSRMLWTQKQAVL